VKQPAMNGLCLLSLLLVACNAHTLMTNITIAGVTRSNCLRPAYPGNLYSRTGVGASDPIMQETPAGQWRGGVASTNYTCGFMPFAGNPAAAKCPVTAGSPVTVSFFHGAGYGDETPAFDQWIARSHKGPFMAFLAKYDGVGGLPAANSWFKIYQSGKIANATGGDWQTVKYASPDGLNANNGGMTFTIPSDIAPGNYLLRTEIIALHSAGALYGAQPYVRCVELTVTGTGKVNPPGVSIPGNWNASHAGMNYKLWTDFNKPYPFPGPAVYTVGSVTPSPTNEDTDNTDNTDEESTSIGVALCISSMLYVLMSLF